MIDYRRWFVSVFCLALFLFDSPVTAADQSPKIDGAAVERGLKQPTSS